VLGNKTCRCNGEDNCGDWSDESSCTGEVSTFGPITDFPVECPAEIDRTLHCDNNKCVREIDRWDRSYIMCLMCPPRRCKGWDYCGDGSADRDCEGEDWLTVDSFSLECLGGSFHCDNNRCIESNKRSIYEGPSLRGILMTCQV
jgi:hypothetical protein